MLKNKLKQEVIAYIVNWNRLYPIDYWWRKKYKVPFGSDEHRQANFIQMYFDYEEERMMKKLMENYDETKEDFGDQFKKSGVGSKMSQKQIDYDFENIDLSSYDTVKETKE